MKMTLNIRGSVCFTLIGLIAVSSEASAQHSTAYTYDALGQLTTINGPGSADRRYVYDDAGNRLISRAAPNAVPVAGDDYYSVGYNTATQIHDLRDNDSDGNDHPIKVTRIFNVRHSNNDSPATVYLRSDGRVNITYGDVGTTTFSYTLTDLEDETTGTGTVFVTSSGGGGPGCEFFC